MNNVIQISYPQRIQVNFSKSHVAIGVFDGVHLGHQFLLGIIKDKAKLNSDSGRSIAITFSVDPETICGHGNPLRILSDAQRIEILSLSGIDDVVVLDFTEELAGLAPEQFLEWLFRYSCPLSINVGVGFRFGKDAQGSVEHLSRWGSCNGVKVEEFPLQEFNGEVLSSTHIRNLLRKGMVEQANLLLGRRYSVRGTVVSGRGAGIGFGFATANLDIDRKQILVPDGVYAAYCLLGGKRYAAAVSVGISPTFESATCNCEVHLIDACLLLYDCFVEVEFERFIRPLLRFESEDELRITIQGDVDSIKAILGK